MNNWDARDEPGQECTLDADFASASRACRHLGIPLHRVNLTREYWTRVFEETLRAYGSGVETPNPDVLCNREIKFGELMGWATRNGFDTLATGHYVQKYEMGDGKQVLMQAVDLGKDQSYFLSQVPSAVLPSALFPAGSLLKSDIRRLAADLGLSHLLHRPESMGMCFIGRRTRFSQFLRDYIGGDGDSDDSGAMVYGGREVGRHGGLGSMTVGQGARIASMGRRLYVARKDKASNTMELVDSLDHPLLNPYSLKANLTWHLPTTDGQLFCSIRSQDKHGVAVKSVSGSAGDERVELEGPVFAPAPGQYAVLYQAVPGHDRRILVASGPIK